MFFSSLQAQLVRDDDPALLPTAGHVHEFKRQQLSSVYFSEGTAVGDLNNDGHPDVVYGPYWFEGPEFKKSHEIYKPVAQPMLRYADHFFAWTHNFNGDGWKDILVVGFPGTPAYVYENPGIDQKAPSPPAPLPQGGESNNATVAKPSQAQTGGGRSSAESPPLHWKKHEVFDWVSNESPQWVDLTGDGKPELVCTRDSCFGFAVPPTEGFGKWTFRAISDKMAPDRFGHGLGVGDIDGDGLSDVLTKDGWFQQPSEASKKFWDYHPFVFTEPGGADMHAYDVNGDGLNDVITSVDAHGWGLVWWEQTRDEAGKISFVKHIIMGSRPSENLYGVYVSEPHSVALADIDGDGLKDIITGKTYWSHHRQSPNWDAGAMVYWFRLRRTDQGADWVPRLMDDAAGIGRQIVAADLTGNGYLDIVTGGMLGCHVMRNSRTWAKGVEYLAAQPKPRRSLADGLKAEDAAARMTVPQGFHVQLAASEPLVHQPVAMALDHRGRVWIAEAHNYPIRAPEGQGKDRIVILEDTNLDGTLDKKTVFIQGLNLVSGLEVGFGGVWVGAAPFLMFISDDNQDDKPDGQPVVLLDGFGYQDTHETLNSFIWGPDGWLYGCHGVFTHSRVGKPGSPDAARVPINAGIWRYHPLRHQFEVHAWGTSNPWGVDFNDYGQAFTTACVIPHLYQVIPGARYQRQAGQHFGKFVYDDIKTIADHLHYAGDIGDHAWWGHEPGIQTDTSDAGGGHAHCGAMVYLGDNWPTRYRNQIFFNNIHGNRVNMDRLVRQGSGYLGRHGDDLLLANDRWFRGINLRYGPDGSVYLIDWYDQNACHRVNPEIWDRSNGRIYNVAYGVPTRKAVNLESMSDTELAALAWHRNDWYVRMSRRILQHRAASGKLDAAAVKAEIGKLLRDEDDTRVLRGLWLGFATGLVTESQLLSTLMHSSPYVTAWGIQLICESGSVAELEIQQLTELGQQKGLDPIVRLALASALQRLPLEQRWPIIDGLVQHASDATDQNLPRMIWYGLEPLVAENPLRAMTVFQNSQIPLIRQWIARRAGASEAALETFLTALKTMSPEDQLLVLQQLMIAFEGTVNVSMPASWKTAYESLSSSNDPSLMDFADRLAVVFGDKRVFANLRTVLADSQRPLEQRQRALQILVQGRDSEAAAALHAALETPELQSPAIRALAGLGSPESARIVLERYSNLIPAARQDAVATLVSRASSAQLLLDAIDAGTLPRNDVHAFHVRQMTNLGDENLTARIEKSWGRVASSTAEQAEQIARFKNLLSKNVLASANLNSGRQLFQNHCASCHKLFGAGELIGPDLTGSNRADLDYILENLIAPDAVVGKDYQMTILLLLDGRVVSGLITRETDSALTVKTINDLIVVAKDEIDEQKLSDRSLMPAGLLDPLTPDQQRDLIGYLASPTQVPLRGLSAPIDPVTGYVPNVFEGEKLAIVEKTAGTATSQNMRGFPADRWSGAEQLWWQGAKPGDRLAVEIEVDLAGTYEFQAVMTMARDYGIVQLYWDGEKLGEPLDLFNEPAVITTGVLSFGTREISAGPHRLSFEILGTNQSAVKSYMVALDYFHLEPVK